jgi:two-component system, chemotaxis family, sensor kinase CheA
MVDADLNLAELEATFAMEAADDIAALEAGLLALEDAPDDGELRRELLRRVHTLKGNASIVGRDALAAFAHAYEERLEQLDIVDASVIASLLGGIDTFRKLLDGGDAAAPAAVSKHIRVGAEKLNRMLDLAGEISIARGRVRQILGGGALDELVEMERQIDQLQAELQELIMRARMVPVGPMFRQYARTVRDTAAIHGKNARLATVGDDVEIDTTAVELLRDPITHMIRNAIDHGIEPSSERVAQGKSPVGHITLAAKHEAGTIIIRVSDDGAGLDRAAIGADDTVIFDPGFTTAKEVTDLSGRGVGMDVVRRGIEALRGTISIESSEGVGTAFTIRLPLTLAVIDGFGVAAGGETWIVPMESVVECVELPSDEPREELSGVLLLRDEIVPYARVRKMFGAQNPSPRERGEGAASAADEGRMLPIHRPSPGLRPPSPRERGEGPSTREHVLIVQHDGSRAGLVVDELFGASQAVIKPLGGYFASVAGIAGSSILGNGRVALILDIATILRNLNHQENA